MKMNSIFHVFIIGVVTSNLFINMLVLAASEEYEAELEKYAKLTEAVSGGFNSGSRVIIRVGNYTFYKFGRGSPSLAGLYVVAIYNNKVLLKASYNTYFTPGASEGLAQDIDKLPYGTFVVAVGMDEPTRLFDERGQNALYQIGAEKGLLGQEFRTSYLCLGVKGLSRGKAIEKVGMEELKHIGRKATEQINFTFPKKKEPGRISRKPGRHEGLMFGDTEAIYYIPENFDPDTAKYLFGIHGAGDWHRPGALTRIDQFRDIADVENLVIIAPAFDCIFNWPIDRRRDLDKNWKFKDPRIIKDRYLWGFIALLNNNNEHRTDLKLIEIFEFFNQSLMKREKFYLDGHSGGGQFVARFVLFHPELIDKAAICSAGTFVFPNRDKDYPYGLKLDDLEKTFGPQIQADDLKLNYGQIDQKLAQMLDLKIFIIAGEKETLTDTSNRSWQGKSTLEKAHNFYKTMRDEDLRLKEKGLRPKSKPYQFELHTIPDVGHNSHETAKKAIELLFPKKKTGADSNSKMRINR